MRAWLRLAVALALAWSPCVEAQDLDFHRYSTVDGLPSAQTLSIHQDTQGYLWFGTSAGLARYDGATFRNWSRADGLRGDTVTAVVGAPDGRILVGFREGGVDVLDGGAIEPLPGEGIDGAAIRAMMADSGGSVWILTATDIVQWVDGRTRRVVPPSDLGLRGPRAIAIAAQGGVWIGADSGLYRVTGSTFEHVGRDLPPSPVRAVIEDASGGLWVGTRSGIYRRRGTGFVRVSPPGREYGPVRTALRAPDGTLWFGSATGAVRVRAGRATWLGSANGLGDDRVNAVLVDHEGSTWFATDGGAAKLVASAFTTYRRAHGLPENFVAALTVGASGRLWVGTRTGIAARQDDGSFVARLRVGELSAGAINTLVADRSGLLIGTDRGVSRWDGEEATLLSSLSEPVRAIQRSRDGLWLGTSAGLYQAADAGTPRRVAALGGLAVNDLATGSDGELWVATTGGGLFTQEGGGFESRLPEAVPADTSIWALASGDDGSMWVATNGAGALRYRTDGTIVQLSRAASGLASDFVQQVIPVEDGGAWLFTNRGLDRWDPAVGITHFDVDDGLASMVGNPGAGVLDAAGGLWLGTPEGLIHFDGRAVVDPGVPPVVVIQEVLVGGQGLDRSELAALAPGENDLEFRFTALTFRNEASTRFQYRMIGAESEEWSRPTSDRRVALLGLPPGSYRFEVQAINYSGLWSTEPAVVSFEIRPAPWQMPAVQLVAGLLLLTIVGAFFRRRYRQVEDERKRLRRMVDKRTRELVEKNTQLERMATTDELTALPNRRFFLESMERELRKMTRLTSEQPLSLLVIDLDRFKSINDRFGHAAGDEVLRQVARRLAQGVRATDLAARYGGEEFAILLPNTKPSGAHFLAEKLRAEVEQTELRFNGTKIGVTISVGVATIAAPQRYDAEVEEELLRRADEAMYRAKTGGRNRVVVAD